MSDKVFKKERSLYREVREAKTEDRYSEPVNGAALDFFIFANGTVAEATVTITLAEYRSLVTRAAHADAEMTRLRDAITAARQAIDELARASQSQME